MWVLKCDCCGKEQKETFIMKKKRSHVFHKNTEVFEICDDCLKKFCKFVRKEGKANEG